MRMRDGFIFLACCSRSIQPDRAVSKPVGAPVGSPAVSLVAPDSSPTSEVVEEPTEDQELLLEPCSMTRIEFDAPRPTPVAARLTIRYEACVTFGSSGWSWEADLVTGFETAAGEMLCGQAFTGVLVRSSPYINTHVGGLFAWSERERVSCAMFELPDLGTEPLTHWSIDLLGQVIWVAELPGVPYLVWTPIDRSVWTRSNGYHIRMVDRLVDR